MQDDAKKQFIPDILFEEYALGELSPEKMKEVESHPDFKEKMDQIEQSNREILEKYPAEQVFQEIKKKAEDTSDNNIITFQDTKIKKSPGRLLPMISAASLFLALGVTLVVVLMNPGANTDEVIYVNRVKGASFGLRIYRQTQEGSELLRENDTVSQGDRLQVGYVSRDYNYGMIASVDGNGNTTLHHPAEAWYSSKIETGEQIYLPYSYILDDAPSYERFYFFVSNTPIDVNALLALMENSQKKVKTGSLPVPGDIEYRSFLLKKENQ